MIFLILAALRIMLGNSEGFFPLELFVTIGQAFPLVQFNQIQLFDQFPS
jgi:hypothetical protein